MPDSARPRAGYPYFVLYNAVTVVLKFASMNDSGIGNGLA